MTNNPDNKKRTLTIPDIKLPFFAYGIFKPGQLAYSKIKNRVDEESLKNVEVNYGMRLRDGVPILINSKNDFHQTNGFLITFKKGNEKQAYKTISNTLLRKLYKWDTIEIDGKKANVLFGVNPDNGSNYIEDPNERINFDGKNDPLFSKAIELIENNLKSDKNGWKLESFFELQMNYMLLWSAIDRYTSLKYNKKFQKWNRERFAEEKTFKEGIKKYTDKRHSPVFSTDDLEIHEFNVDDPLNTLYYYYTFRCNVVHRGKTMIGDYDMLKTATEELLEIFKEVLENTFNR